MTLAAAPRNAKSQSASHGVADHTSYAGTPASPSSVADAGIIAGSPSPVVIRYFPPSRCAWLLLIRALRAFDTDISPLLSPFRPIRSRISPRDSPSLCRIRSSNASRLLPRRAGDCRPAGARRAALAGFRRFIGLDSGKLAIYRVEFALQFFLPAEDLLALRAEPVSLSCNKLGKAAVRDVAFIIKIRHSCSPFYVSRVCRHELHSCKSAIFLNTSSLLYGIKMVKACGSTAVVRCRSMR